MENCRIVVSGRVQGVSFRYHTREKAHELGINGFVMNQPDGTVLIEASGESEPMTRFIDWCKKGPVLARVDRVEVIDSDNAHGNDFTIHR